MASLLQSCNEQIIISSSIHITGMEWNTSEKPGNKFISTLPFILLEDILFCAGSHDGRRGPPTPGIDDFPWVFPERNIWNNFGGFYSVFEATAAGKFLTIRILNNMFNQTQRSQNFTLPIYMDDVPEGVEELNVLLSLQPSVPSTSVNVTPALATVRIHDFSSKFIGQFDINIQD